MPQQVDNGLTTYSFSEEELISAATFNILQKMYIQTQRAMAANDLVSLEFNPEKLFDYARARGNREGFIAACDFFLDHENAEAARERWLEIKQQASREE